MTAWSLSPDRYLGPGPDQRALARGLYDAVADLPLVCPHGHVDPQIFADPEARLGPPGRLFVVPDHYVFRMLYSQGLSMEEAGIPTTDGTPTEDDDAKIWQRFAESFHLFRGTPTGLWIKEELIGVFGVEEQLDDASARHIYEQLVERLSEPEFAPRALFDRFNIQVLATTDPADSGLEQHRSLQEQGWGRRVRPTFRPDAVLKVAAPEWTGALDGLQRAGDRSISSYGDFVSALEARREDFKRMGATATDHSAVTPDTARLSEREAGSIFTKALRRDVTSEEGARFGAHMLSEMARMSAEDGLVMQLHVGSFRDHNEDVARRFGTDMGADIPLPTDWTRGLHPLLNRYGNAPRFQLILFTLDESTYGRELAPLAGHYPCLMLGPPWWFYDSPNGMSRYLDSVVETAGLFNLAGFNDDTRAFASIPVRHDMWRRVTCNWLAGRVLLGMLTEEEAADAAAQLAYRAALTAYRLDG